MNESNENESMIPEETAPAVEEITAEKKPEKEETPGGEEEKKPGAVGFLYDMVEMLGLVSVVLMLIFAFVVRLNVVDGDSMKQTLHDGEYLVVAELCYTPARGDIVVIHDVTAKPYDNPIVKRVIATAGQTVDIDFDTWTLTVDGEVVDESAYRYLIGVQFSDHGPGRGDLRPRRQPEQQCRQSAGRDRDRGRALRGRPCGLPPPAAGRVQDLQQPLRRINGQSVIHQPIGLEGGSP